MSDVRFPSNGFAVLAFFRFLHSRARPLYHYNSAVASRQASTSPLLLDSAFLPGITPSFLSSPPYSANAVSTLLDTTVSCVSIGSAANWRFKFLNFNSRRCTSRRVGACLVAGSGSLPTGPVVWLSLGMGGSITGLDAWKKK